MNVTGIKDGDAAYKRWSRAETELLDSYREMGFITSVGIIRCLKNLIETGAVFRKGSFQGLNPEFSYFLEKDLEAIRGLEQDLNEVTDHLIYFAEYEEEKWKQETGSHDEAAIFDFMLLESRETTFRHNLGAMIMELKDLAQDPTEKAYDCVRDSLPGLEAQAWELCRLLDPSKEPRKSFTDQAARMNKKVTETMIQRMLDNAWERSQEKNSKAQL